MLVLQAFPLSLLICQIRLNYQFQPVLLNKETDKKGLRMKDTDTHLSTLKAMYNANLTRTELKVLLHLLEHYGKDITDKAVAIASALVMDTTNLSRTLKSLKQKNVIAERKHTQFMYVQHYFKWGK